MVSDMRSCCKIIAPITTIILVRLLSQEVFGIVASITAITSLADMLSDAGSMPTLFNISFLQIKKKNLYSMYVSGQTY